MAGHVPDLHDPPVILLYIDPGAGSLVLQAIIAAALAVPFFFRNAIRSTVQRFKRAEEPDPDTEQPTE